MKRVSIELFGQLRFWELQKTLPSFIQTINKLGYEVDLFGTFWKDNYSTNLLEQGKLTIFDNLQLIEEPSAPLGSLLQYYYCLRESIEFRKKFNRNYDFYIIARPDLKLTFWEGYRTLFDNFIKKWNEINVPTVYNLDKFQPDTGRMDDKILSANKEALDIISNLYTTYVEVDEDAILKLEYHRSLGKYLVEKKVNILEIPKWFSYDLIRHSLQRELDFDDGVFVDGKFLRNEAKKIQNYKEYIWFTEKYQKDIH